MLPPFLIYGVAAAVVGFGAYYYFWGDDSHVSEESDATNTGGSGVTLAKGLRTSHSGIRVNERQIKFAIKMRSLASYDILQEIVITSGIRTYEGQARAMLDMYNRDAKAFRDLYKQAAKELEALGVNTVAAWTPKVEDLYNRNILKKTGHTTGGAIDFRSRDLSEAQVNELKRAANAAGARKAYLDAGPCLHVDIP